MAPSTPSPFASSAMEPSLVQAHILQFRMLLPTWITHFKSLAYIKESTMEMLDRVVAQKIIKLSVQESRVREAVGSNVKIWADLVELLRVASSSVEGRSYGPLDGTGYEGPNSNSIVANSDTLLKDLDRLDILLQVARNVVTVGEKVQNLAAQVGFDREVCTMINLCIKITARGYDGDGNGAEEDKWQGVINGFKKLLIISLQFLSNMTTKNERLKLMLWTELFDNAAEWFDGPPEPKNPKGDPSENQPDEEGEASQKESTQHRHEENPDLPSRAKAMLTPLFLFAATCQDQVRNKLCHDPGPPSEQVMREISRQWRAMSEHEKDAWRRQHDLYEAKYRRDIELWIKDGRPEPARLYDAESSSHYRTATSTLEQEIAKKAVPVPAEKKEVFDVRDEDRRPSFAAPFGKSENMESAGEGLKKLQEGKQQLLKRLESNASGDRDRGAGGSSARSPLPMASNSAVSKPAALPSHQKQTHEDETEEAEVDEDEDDGEEEENSEDDESSDENEYALPDEDGRGLLTDVPLILGPNEIEILPMIIMNGLVPPLDEGRQREGRPESHVIDMPTIRCHLLLAHENGRNLLRELLIFVAAWDLREEELYFKFMVQIMEAIASNGLMPFAYGAFKESKDIISPAQAVIMKLLTKIFQSRGGFIGAPPKSKAQREKGGEDSSAPSALSVMDRHDVQIIHCLFSEFRQNIVPQICALIFLQGQIRAGHAHLEDFPLNLWDMERMYEGVYQYLEFLAILTEREMWKHVFAYWEVTCELTTMIRELEIAISKQREVSTQRAFPAASSSSAHQSSDRSVAPDSLSNRSQANEKDSKPKPVSVERPYDVNTSPTNLADADPASRQTNTTSTEPTAAESASPNPQTTSPLHDEPADFEWRNLKKLCVLVISSLVWKNKVLQDQVRHFGGITAILSCCDHDEHNPSIREHAIMCLRFLIEGNEENAAAVRWLGDKKSGIRKSAANRGNVPKSGAAAEKSFQHTKKTALPNTVAERQEQLGMPCDDPLLHNYDVPPEVTDPFGYETYLDEDGDVALRRRQVIVPVTDVVAPSTTASDDAGSMSNAENHSADLAGNGTEDAVAA